MRIGVAFYIWVGVFNMVAVAQFWAFANDLYTTERGKRLFPLVGIGASLGALVGAGLTAYFFKGMGPYTPHADRGVRAARAGRSDDHRPQARGPSEGRKEG